MSDGSGTPSSVFIFRKIGLGSYVVPLDFYAIIFYKCHQLPSETTQDASLGHPDIKVGSADVTTQD